MRHKTATASIKEPFSSRSSRNSHSFDLSRDHPLWENPSMNRFRAALAIVVISACACAGNPAGSNWMLADLNKRGKRYAAFPTDEITIGGNVPRAVEK